MTETKERKRKLRSEYEQVNSNPIVKNLIQAVVMVADFAVMFLLIWNMFTLCIPPGSWLNIVDGASMEPTMHSKQIIFTDMSEIERGDVVTAYVPDAVVEKYPEKEGMLLVKRVIGVPGDTIEITNEGISVNGEMVNEDYLPENFKTFTYKEGGQNTLTLMSDEYYIVGDNREVSYDSRTFGPIKATDLKYKQSETPTANFWLKAVLVLMMLLLTIFLYMLIEYILIETIYAVFYQKKETRKNKVVKKEEMEGDISNGDDFRL